MCPVIGEFGTPAPSGLRAGDELPEGGRWEPPTREREAAPQRFVAGQDLTDLISKPAGPGYVQEAGFGLMSLLGLVPSFIKLAGPALKAGALIGTGVMAGELIEGIGEGAAPAGIAPSPGTSVGSGAAPSIGVGGIPISGPGVPEPPRAMVAKQWSIVANSKTAGTFRVYFFKLIDGRIMCYNPLKREWKIWRPKKNLVLSSNPRLKDLKKLDRIYTRMTKMVTKFAPKPKQATRQVASKYLSAAEKKLIEAR